MRDRGDTQSLEALEVALLALLAGAVLLALVVSAIAGVAGWLFGGGWVSVSLADMPSVLERLPNSLSDPRRAWPPEAPGSPTRPGGVRWRPARDARSPERRRRARLATAPP